MFYGLWIMAYGFMAFKVYGWGTKSASVKANKQKNLCSISAILCTNFCVCVTSLACTLCARS